MRLSRSSAITSQSRARRQRANWWRVSHRMRGWQPADASRHIFYVAIYTIILWLTSRFCRRSTTSRPMYPRTHSTTSRAVNNSRRSSIVATGPSFSTGRASNCINAGNSRYTSKGARMQTNPRPLTRLALRTCLLVAIFIVAIVGLTSIPMARAASIGSVRNVSNDSGESIVPRVAQDPDGNIHVVWSSSENNGKSHKVRYVKGTWNGSGYDFGGSSIVADVGSFQYSTPAVAVAPNGTLLVA